MLAFSPLGSHVQRCDSILHRAETRQERVGVTGNGGDGFVLKRTKEIVNYFAILSKVSMASVLLIFKEQKKAHKPHSTIENEKYNETA